MHDMMPCPQQLARSLVHFRLDRDTHTHTATVNLTAAARALTAHTRTQKGPCLPACH